MEARPRRRTTQAVSAPAGFHYTPEFIGVDEERDLLERIASLPLVPVRMHGVAGRRQVVHFGIHYNLDGGDLSAAPPIPRFLVPLCARAAIHGRFPEGALLEALVTRYEPGAGIGWHRDAPPFGPTVVGISLANPCEFRLRLEAADNFQLYRLVLEPRSVYVLTGTARFRWQHSIPAVSALRYSLTVRTVKPQARAIRDPSDSPASGRAGS